MVQRLLTWRAPAGNACFLAINELKLRSLLLGKAMVVTPSYQWSSRAEGTYPGPNSLHPGAAVQHQVSPAELRSHGMAVTEVPQPVVQLGTPFTGPLCKLCRGVCSASGGRDLGEFLPYTHEGFLPGDGALKVVGISVAAVQPCWGPQCFWWAN